MQFTTLESQKEIWAEGQLHFADLVLDGWLIVEIDGAIKYSGQFGDELSVTAEELRREKRLKNLGYEFLRCDWPMLRDGNFIPTLQNYLQRPSRRPKLSG